MDKPIYKAGDIVKFWVVLVDIELKPVTLDSELMSVQIHNSENALMKVWNNVNVTKGVFSGEMKITDQPMLGYWELSAVVGHEVCSTEIVFPTWSNKSQFHSLNFLNFDVKISKNR